jgi:cytochrome c
MKFKSVLLVTGLLSLGMTGSAFAAVDAVAAKALAKSNNCFKCHQVDKAKKGPSYKKIAAKLKGKPDSEDKMVKYLMNGAKVKLEDGTEDDHKIIETKDEKEIRNLVAWIMATK